MLKLVLELEDMKMSIHNKRTEAIKDLQSLLNVGPAIAKRLYSIGIKTAKQAKQMDPQKVYEILKKKESGKLDICVLYILQGAILNVPWWECKEAIKCK